MGMGSANERQSYISPLSLIGCAHNRMILAPCDNIQISKLLNATSSDRPCGLITQCVKGMGSRWQLTGITKRNPVECTQSHTLHDCETWPGTWYRVTWGVINTVASFPQEVISRLAKRPLVFNGHLANRGWTSLVKETRGPHVSFRTPTLSTISNIPNEPIRCDQN